MLGQKHPGQMLFFGQGEVVAAEAICQLRAQKKGVGGHGEVNIVARPAQESVPKEAAHGVRPHASVSEEGGQLP